MDKQGMIFQEKIHIKALLFSFFFLCYKLLLDNQAEAKTCIAYELQ